MRVSAAIALGLLVVGGGFTPATAREPVSHVSTGYRAPYQDPSVARGGESPASSHEDAAPDFLQGDLHDLYQDPDVAYVGDFPRPSHEDVAPDLFHGRHSHCPGCCHRRDHLKCKLCRGLPNPCRSTCDMPQHIPYVSEPKFYYYFRPYNWFHIPVQQDDVRAFGGDPRHPYDNRLFENVYEQLQFDDPAPEHLEISPTLEEANKQTAPAPNAAAISSRNNPFRTTGSAGSRASKKQQPTSRTPSQTRPASRDR